MEGIYSLHRENKLVVGSGRHIQSSQGKQAGGRKWKAYTVFTGKTSWWWEVEGIYSLHRENKLVVGSGRHIQSSQGKQAGGRK